MNKRNLVIGGAFAALSAGLIALPGSSAAHSSQQDDASSLEQKVQRLQSNVDAAVANKAYVAALESLQDVGQEPENTFALVVGDEGASWLGVETREVSSDFAKEHKLPAERGVILG